ncbi:MAG: NYN domain-containing protein [Chloroflexota bacterium]|nr:NYN domain-containing protein [Chloroflexota bacterium]MDE2682647.1 NYN domain-containing protein [Chloroflexota bacterium]
MAEPANFLRRLGRRSHRQACPVFTAQAQDTPRDSSVAARQQVYLRALATLPKVNIHYGLFVVRDVLMPLTDNPMPNNPAIVRVTRTEEKRTDVNLATALLLDCFDNDCDEVVVISNDSDLIAPVTAVRQRFGKSVGVISPQRSQRRSSALAQAASWSYGTINRHHFANNQLPAQIADANGTFTKPATW